MKTTNGMKMHVSLFVIDLNKTVEFYNHFFQTTPTKLKGDYVKYSLEDPALVISFIENKGLGRPVPGHLGFVVSEASKVTEYRDAIKDHIRVEREEVGETCCYAVQDKFWVSDPDGNEWEVYYFHKDSEDNQHASTCCAPSSVVDKIETKSACCDHSEACC